VLLHSPLDRLNENSKKRAILKQDGDKARCFTFDGATHILSEASITDLREKVQARYPGADITTFKVDERNFRPNIGIKGVTSYAEDTFMEMRIGNCLLRNIGPTFRCNDVMTDY
jgi:uncharacterized protein YcbX